MASYGIAYRPGDPRPAFNPPGGIPAGATVGGTPGAPSWLPVGTIIMPAGQSAPQNWMQMPAFDQSSIGKPIEGLPGQFVQRTQYTPPPDAPPMYFYNAPFSEMRAASTQSLAGGWHEDMHAPGSWFVSGGGPGYPTPTASSLGAAPATPTLGAAPTAGGFGAAPTQSLSSAAMPTLAAPQAAAPNPITDAMQRQAAPQGGPIPAAQSLQAGATTDDWTRARRQGGTFGYGR